MRIANVLSIAGSDPSGGAGVQADLKTFAALGCYGMAAITALTAQNTQGVFDIHAVPARHIAAQIDAIFADIEVDAVKIGMLASAEIAAAVAQSLNARRPAHLVLDPVLVASSGDALASAGLAESIREKFFALASLITPNLSEAAALTGGRVPRSVEDMKALAVQFVGLGARAVLIKGGHLEGEAVDVLFDGETFDLFSAPRVVTPNTHGTGCTLASAVAARLAQGAPLRQAVGDAKTFLTHALQAADALNVGHGRGPLNHFFKAR